ncbi:MAG: Uma2 family endonuclease [Deltaproteobacteria bacterium]|nr:Uma2 family endonuclease [Deltaproteobacteria bacterium]
MTAQVVDGELSVMPRPRPRHQRGAGRLLRHLGPFDDDPGAPGGWVLLPEPELHLGHLPDIVAPDLAGWRRERFPADGFNDDAPAFLAVAADWVCEVLSASTEALDRGRKMRVWRRERIGHVWLLSPELRTLEVYALTTQETPAGVRDRYTLVDTYEGDARVLAEPFEALELDLAALWAL